MRIPTTEQLAEIEIKRSKFIAHAYPITSTDEVKPLIKHLWKLHPNASHVVHAFVLGFHGDQFGMSDDHEPKNTAGRPALEVLKGSGLTHILVLIVRYFGGTKLGTGGLVKAYTQATQESIAGIPSEELIERTRILLEVPYDLYTPIHTLLIEHRADDLSEDFATEIRIIGRIPQDHFESAKKTIMDRSAGRVLLQTFESD